MRAIAKPNGRKAAKPSIEREAAIVPGLIAESVLECASTLVGQGIPSVYMAKLKACVADGYAHNRRFKSKIRGKSGREYMRMYMQHWLARLLRKDASPLCAKLPSAFYWPAQSWREWA